MQNLKEKMQQANWFPAKVEDEIIQLGKRPNTEKYLLSALSIRNIHAKLCHNKLIADPRPNIYDLVFHF